MLKIWTIFISMLLFGLVITSCEVDDSCGTGFAATPCEVDDSNGNNEVDDSSGNNSTRTYEGCDGLSDLIGRIKTDGLGKMQLYGVVNIGDEDACNSAIRTFNQPELLK